MGRPSGTYLTSPKINEDVALTSTATNVDATVTNAIKTNVSSQLSTIAEKTSGNLVDADIFLIEDSASSNAKKKVLASTIKTYTGSGSITLDYLGDGSDGAGQIATIANPGATGITGITTVTVGGYIAEGTYYYKYNCENLSGTTLLNTTSTSQVTTGSTSKNTITLPAGASGTAKRNIYRSTDNTNFYYIGSIANNTAGATFEDIYSAVGDIAPASNTTSATAATKSGILNLTSLTLTTSQTIFVSSTGNFLGKLLIKCTGLVDIQTGAIINGDGCFYNAGLPSSIRHSYFNSTTRYYGFSGTNGFGLIGTETMETGEQITGWIIRNKQGATTAGLASTLFLISNNSLAGASIYLIADRIKCQGTIKATGGGTYQTGGGAGGRVELWAIKEIDASNGTLTAIGGSVTGSTSKGGGGGGGYVILCSERITNTLATITVSGGTGYSATEALFYGGGGHAGRGGRTGTINGTVGTIIYNKSKIDSQLLQNLLG